MDLAARIRHGVRAPYAWTFFFLTAFIVFSSFFLEGKVLLSSTDLTFNHYPNLLFGHRMLRQGDFGLWNPLIFGGVDFSGSVHHHMLHPLNWPLLLLPEQYVLHGVTVQCYLEISLLGLLAFHIIRGVQDDDLVALFVAVVAQLGGFTWFTTTTLIGTHLLFAAAASIYVIVSHADRRPILNYLYLAAVLFRHSDDGARGLHQRLRLAGRRRLFLVDLAAEHTAPLAGFDAGRGPRLRDRKFCLAAVRLWPVMHGTDVRTVGRRCPESGFRHQRRRLFRFDWIRPGAVRIAFRRCQYVCLGPENRRDGIRSFTTSCTTESCPFCWFGCRFCADWGRGHSSWRQPIWSSP